MPYTGQSVSSADGVTSSEHVITRDLGAFCENIEAEPAGTRGRHLLGQCQDGHGTMARLYSSSHLIMYDLNVVRPALVPCGWRKGFDSPSDFNSPITSPY